MGSDIINKNINEPDFLLVDDIEKGFLRGSDWKNIYSFYKYKVDSLNIKNDFDKLIYMLQVYNFLSIELSLYINTHINNNEAIEMLKKSNGERNKLYDYIEAKTQALSNNSEILNGYYMLNMPWSAEYVGI